MKKTHFAWLVSSALAVTACDETPLASTNDINRHVGSAIIESAFSNVAQESRLLAQASATLCANFNDSNLAHAQQAWNGAWKAWQAASVFTFGPLGEEARLRIEFFPDARNLVETRTEELIQTPGDISQASAPAQGLPAMEYLLFAARENQQDICPVAVNVADFLASSLDAIDQAWPTYISQEFALSGAAGLTQLVESVIREIVNVRDDELGIPLGNSNGNAAQAGQVSSPYAQQSFAAIEAELNIIETLLRGIGGPALGYRIRSLGGGVYEDDVLALIEQTLRGLSTIDSPLVTAVTQETPRGELYHVYDGSFAQLRNQIQDLGGAVGVVPGFNANDGD